MKLRPFSRHDWDGWAGAEEEPGKPALIGEDNDFVVIVDLNGIGLFTDIDNDCINYQLKCSYGLGKLIAANLPDVIDENQLLELGFTKYE